MQTVITPTPGRTLDRSVAQEDWSDFLDGVSAELAGSPVLIDVCWPGLAPGRAARGVLHALLYDERDDVLEIAIRIPTPGPFSVFRHLIERPESLAGDGAAGLLPSVLRVEDDAGRVTVVRLLPSPVFAG